MTETTPTILVLGGTSDIGRAVAREYAARGVAVQLAGRDRDGLDRNARDLQVRFGVPATVHLVDALDFAGHAAFVGGLDPLPDVAVCLLGLMEDQAAVEKDPALASLVLLSNFNGPANLLGLIANRFAARGAGTIVGVSSVAGDRGRARNYVYGAAKAGLTAFLSGLRARFAGTRIRIVTVKPGFVRTRMTEGMRLPPLLTASPEDVATAIRRAEQGRRDVIYVSWKWRVIMTIVRLLPESVFKRLRF
ncbi:MAG TPA: SDR family oxidoreductase [Alphaproteobacteria bacterium]|nr:SDR family oxidoreductase [Alphaproteobacteria bacterium]